METLEPELQLEPAAPAIEMLGEEDDEYSAGDEDMQTEPDHEPEDDSRNELADDTDPDEMEEDDGETDTLQEHESRFGTQSDDESQK
jgi:hypothetical protein